MQKTQKTGLEESFTLTYLEGFFMFMKGLLICGVSLHVRACVCVCVVLIPPLPSVNREAPKQGSTQVEVMEGTGSDKMYREESWWGGRVRQRGDRPRQIPSHANHNNKGQEK